MSVKHLSVWICLVKCTSRQNFRSELHVFFLYCRFGVIMYCDYVRCWSYVIRDLVLLYRGDAKKSLSGKLGATSKENAIVHSHFTYFGNKLLAEDKELFSNAVDQVFAHSVLMSVSTEGDSQLVEQVKEHLQGNGLQVKPEIIAKVKYVAFPTLRGAWLNSIDWVKQSFISDI